MADGRLYTGTSGYSYKEWKGSFYPERLAQNKFLNYYAERLSTVEINNTFYRFPKASMLEDWRESTPDGFSFAVKATQKITHQGRLQDVGELTGDFVERCRVLGPKLGPILFQLPPFLRRDDQRLNDFLDILPAEARYAIEFRHTSWFDDAVLERLRQADVALCLSEGDRLQPPRTATAGFCYLRLRKDDYDASDIADWRGWIEEQRGAGRDVFCYLKHDKKGTSPEPLLQSLQGKG